MEYHVVVLVDNMLRTRLRSAVLDELVKQLQYLTIHKNEYAPLKQHLTCTTYNAKKVPQ